MYYEPSGIWDVYGAKTRNEYVEKYVVKSNFHKEVPEHIINSYETAEYLMAHAYYHWPMYDEALKKILGIFEMAIKLKCQLLGIEIEVKAKNEKIKKQDLAILIDQLISKKGFPKELKFKLQGTRVIRNMLAHPNSHSFMGALNMGAIIRTINIINQLFLPVNWYKDQQYAISKLKNSYLDLKKDLFILPYNKQNILVFDIQIEEAINIQNNWVYYCKFQPVFNDMKNIIEHKISPPIILFLKDVLITKTDLTAINFETNEIIKVSKTEKLENLKKYQNHISEFSSLNEDEKHIYEMMQSSNTDSLIQKIIHKNCWV